MSQPEHKLITLIKLRKQATNSNAHEKIKQNIQKAIVKTVEDLLEGDENEDSSNK